MAKYGVHEESQNIVPENDACMCESPMILAALAALAVLCVVLLLSLVTGGRKKKVGIETARVAAKKLQKRSKKCFLK